MAHDVFISHSARDRRTAEVACAFLEAEGLTCWIAPRDVAAGAPWASALVEAIEASRAMVLVFSRCSNDSEHVLREVTAAADAGVPILPFRIEDTQPSKELGYYIRRAHWLDALAPPVEAHLPTLRDAVRGLVERRRAPAAAPSRGGELAAPSPRPLARALGSARWRAAGVAALLVLALAAAAAWTGRSGTLTIESEPADAAVSLNGSPAGRTPLVLDVASGSHGVLVRRAGFKDWSRVVEVAPGEKASFSRQLVVADPHDGEAMNLLAKPLGVALERYTLPEAERGEPEGDPLELIVPRGTVRPSDVATLVMDVDSERVEPSGELAVRRGDTTLWRAPFEPGSARYEVALPASLRETIRPGETLVWGWWPKRGPPTTSVLQVVGDEVAAPFAAVERALATQPEAFRAHLRAQIFLDRRLFTGAFLEGSARALADPADVRAGAVMEQALVRSGGSGLRLVARLRDALLDAPGVERAKVFGAP